MRNLEKLERERREMASRIDELSNEQASRKNSMDMNKSVGDLNMKLKMEIGALRGENEGLVKKNEETRREIGALEEQIQVSPDLDLELDRSGGKLDATQVRNVFQNFPIVQDFLRIFAQARKLICNLLI